MASVAFVAGTGPGLGAALARRFAREGCAVALMARSEGYLKELASELVDLGVRAHPVTGDVTDPGQVARAFDAARDALGPVDLLVSHASAAAWKGLQALSAEEFERAWRVTVMGAFLCAKEAVPDMIENGAGTILFTSATSAVRGRKGAAAFSSAKFGLRGLAQSMATELWPNGIHVAHVVIDGMIDTPAVRREHAPGPDEPLLKPDEIADAYWHLANQKRSAWTLELDLRPYNEAFFE